MAKREEVLISRITRNPRLVLPAFGCGFAALCSLRLTKLFSASLELRHWLVRARKERNEESTATGLVNIGSPLAPMVLVAKAVQLARLVELSST